MYPLPQVSHVFSMIVQQEHQQSLPPVKAKPNFFINSSFTPFDKGHNNTNRPPKPHPRNNICYSSNKRCVYCHCIGHTIETCYTKHGYPSSQPRYLDYLEDLLEDVYMVIPPGLFGYPSNHCCKLKKFLYDLKQAIRTWYDKYDLFYCYLQDMPSPCWSKFFFIKSIGSTFIALFVYVDDIVLNGNCASEITKIKATLHSHFHIKDLGLLKYFLEIELLTPTKDLIKDFGIMGSKPFSTHLDDFMRFHWDSSEPLYDPLSYRRLVGCLIYLTNIIPDIAFVTQQFS